MESQHQKILSEGWLIRSSAEVQAAGENVSQPVFATADWIPASVPSTVLASLVARGLFDDPYVGMNLQKIPREPFEKSWWYRTAFVLSDEEASRTSLLEFDGINYAGDIWLNGRRVATADHAQGAFRRFQYNVSDLIIAGENVLAVEVTPPKPGDFSTGFVDWNPPPPDRNMGLFRPVRLRFCGDVSIENPFVQTRLNLNSLAEAWLTVTGEVVNHSDRAVSGVLEASIEGICLRQDVQLQPRVTRRITLGSQEHTELHIDRPRIWWPHDIGKPELYALELKFSIDSQVSDATTVRFGIREVGDYRTPEGHRGFKVNGREVLIKGAGWTDDLLLADTRETLDAELRYVRHMNLTCIRCEGIWGKDPTLYDLCDEYGILVMVGWSCHWEHEQYPGKPVDERYGGVTSPEDIDLVSRSWRDQLLWLRNHPSIFVWAVASDELPAPELERRYIEIFRQCDPTRPYLASTGGVGSEQRIVCREDLTSEVSGSSGVKMLGPYEYTPPIYWYTDTRRGGAYGFNTETSPGAVVPAVESLRKMLPADHLWPVDECWHFHCGLNEFSTLDCCREAIRRRYGGTDSVEEFALKAQMLNYELVRPMFEAFRVNGGRATGVIQWMLNAAWPKMYWQLYDWFLMPTGAFYGAKKACEPVQLVYHYGDHSVYLVGAGPRACPDQSEATTGDCPYADIRVYDIQAKLCLAVRLPIAPGKVFRLPRLGTISTTYFLHLGLLDQKGDTVGSNFYWLSMQPDILDYETKVKPWEYYTPSSEYADFTLLDSLPPAYVGVTCRIENGGKLVADLHNAGDKIAFFIELLLIDDATGEPVLPIFWQDNFISLLPGEKRRLAAESHVMARAPILIVRGWNVESQRCVLAGQ